MPTWSRRFSSNAAVLSLEGGGALGAPTSPRLARKIQHPVVRGMGGLPATGAGRGRVAAATQLGEQPQRATLREQPRGKFQHAAPEAAALRAGGHGQMDELGGRAVGEQQQHPAGACAAASRSNAVRTPNTKLKTNTGSSGLVTALPERSCTTEPPPTIDRRWWFCSQA